METWDDGRPVELKRGDTATAKNMERDQLHGVFFHNPGTQDVQIEITAPWDGKPEKLSVPGSRPGGTMPMAIAFWYDEDDKAGSTSVSVEVVEDGPVTAFICDLTLPTAGIRSVELKEDRPDQFDKLKRFYHKPATQPYVWELNSSIEAFVAVRFQLDRALVVVLNHDRDQGPRLHALGGAEGKYTVVTTPGSTLREHLLGNAQIYGLFFYNANNNNKSATMTVAWTDTGGNPKSRKVTVPGTTAESGRASVALIWGGDIQRTGGKASAVTATLSAANGATVDAFLGSLTQPIDKSGLEQDTELKDGVDYRINKFSRFYRVLAAQNYSLTLSTAKNTQFIVVEFDPDGATVLVVRQRGKLEDFVVPLTDGAERRHNIKHTTEKELLWSPLRGNNQQIVILHADSVLNLGDAHIKLDPVESRIYSGSSDDRQLQGQGSR